MSSLRGLRLVRTTIVALAACWGAAAAQPTVPQRAGEKVSLSAEFGWGGSLLPADRFAPVRVTLSGADRAVGAVLVMEFQQDATQRARIVTPAATTPGAATEIEIVAAIPAGCERVSLSLLDERGRRIARETYSTTRSGRDLDMPVAPAPGIAIVVAAGRAAPRLSNQDQAVAAKDDDDGESNDDERKDPWLAVSSVQHDLDSLPTTWAAYEGVATLIIDAEAAATIDPVALDTIRTWVLWGGRLALVADEPGHIWARWFENPAQAMPIEIGGPARVRTPDSLRVVIEEANVGAVLEDRADPLMNAIHARAITLTEVGAAHGWRLGHPGADGGGLVAEGPLGFGWVVVLGFDPALASANESVLSAGVLWRTVLAAPMADWLARARDPDSFGWFMTRSGGDDGEMGAIERALSTLDELSVPIDLAFTLIALGAFALAMIVGPVNALVLKRLDLRHAAWLATIACAAVATAFAWFLPEVVRTSPTTLVRNSAEDALVLSEPTRAPLTWRTVTTGLMTNTSGTVPFGHADPRGFWRGVSPLWSYETQLGPAFETIQTSAGVAGWRQRGGRPQKLAQNQWSLRTSLSMEPTGLVLHASAVPDGEGWSVTVTGIPDDSRVAAAALEVRGGFFNLLRPEHGPSGWRFASGERTEWLPEEFGRQVAHRPGHTGGAMPEGARQLPGVWQRDEAARARVASGRWGAIHLLLSHDSPDLPLDVSGVRYRTDRALRVLVPLGDRALTPEPDP